MPKSSWVLSQTTNALLCTGLFCVYRRICFPNSVHVLQAPTVFILFIAVSVFRVAHRATALHSDKAVESSLS